MNLWVSDINRLFKTQEDIEKKLSKFKHVSVLGTIVNVERTGPNLQDEGSNDKRPVVYHLDDGTGVIPIVYFLHDKVAKQRKTFSLDQEGSGPMLDKIKNYCQISGHLKTGTTVQVKGVPQVDRWKCKRSADDSQASAEIEIKAFSVKLVIDPNEEIERMFLVDKIRKSGHYSHLFSA